MGRKKGKQSGDYPSKSERANHRRILYVDHASEADAYRNPMVRVSSSPSRCVVVGGGGGGGWHADGRGDRGDKWSAIFSSSSSSSSSSPSHRSSSVGRDDASSVAAMAIATATANRTTTNAGLSRLRRLLEERRNEDRQFERQSRLRMQRMSVTRSSSSALDSSSMSSHRGVGIDDLHSSSYFSGRHEIGWLLSHDDDDDDDVPPRMTTMDECKHDDDDGTKDGAANGNIVANAVPSLQLLASRALGPHLPAYCEYYRGGAFDMGEYLKSCSSIALSEISISLAVAATSSSSSIDGGGDGGGMFRMTTTTTTDAAVRALTRSGTATGLVLGGGGYARTLFGDDDDDHYGSGNDEDRDGNDDEDEGWFSDDGLLSLCPRISPPAGGDIDGVNGDPTTLGYSSSENDEDCRAAATSGGVCDVPSSSSSSSCDDDENYDWESLDYDMCLNSRMMGCFHLRRLELIDIPLKASSSSSLSRPGGGGGRGGISVTALRTVLRSCSNLTHLSLAGCFRNWADVGGGRSSLTSTTVVAGGHDDDISFLLCGNGSLVSLTRSIILICKHHGNDDGKIMQLLPQLMLHNAFQENYDDDGGDIVGLDELLPDLKVLDVSYCGWVTPGMIVRYLLNVWRRRFVATGYVRGDGIDWEDVVGDFDSHAGNDSDGIRLIGFSGTGHFSKVVPSLRHLNIRGCDGLLLDAPSSPSWIAGWRECGLFDGIHMSVERQFRSR